MDTIRDIDPTHTELAGSLARRDVSFVFASFSDVLGPAKSRFVPDGYQFPLAPSGALRPTPAYDVEATLDAVPFLVPMVEALCGLVERGRLEEPPFPAAPEGRR